MSTDDDLPPGFDPDNPDDIPLEIQAGRRYPFHIVGDWVHLAIDPKTGKRLASQPRTMYSTLMMHVNHNRGDNIVWPGTDALAELVGLGRADKVKAWVDPLVRIGAVEVRVIRWGEGRKKSRNLYIVHETPPPGYTGLVMLSDFYAERDARLVAEGKRKPRKKKAGAPDTGIPGTGRKNPRSAPETLKTGVPEAPETGSPEPPKTGQEPQQQPQQQQLPLHEAEEEAAREGAQQESEPIEENTAETEAEELPEPSFFAMITLRQIIAEAPQTRAAGDRERAEVIGDAEVDEFARAFDAEVARLEAAGLRGAGGELSLWLSRGLETANSLYAVLQSRLTPGKGLAALIRQPKPKPKASPKPPVVPDPAPAACTVHDGAQPGRCTECEEAEKRERAERQQRTLRGAAAARRNMGLDTVHT